MDLDDNPAAPLSDSGNCLKLVLRRPNRSFLTETPVTRPHLSEIAASAWLETCLRKGKTDVQLADLEFKVCCRKASEGFIIELEVERPGAAKVRVPLHCSPLAELARQTADRMVADGLLLAGEVYTYAYEIGEPIIGGFESDSDSLCIDRPFRFRVPMTQLHFVRIPLSQLLSAAKAVGTINGEFPVFFSAGALVKTERFARRGDTLEKPVECGAALIGSLMSCPDSGELGVIITDALEVEAEKQTVASLSYSGHTFTAIQNILRARRKARPELGEQWTGQAHSHPFPPGTCVECEKRPTCSLTSAFLSTDDELWHRSVFARQPWAVCQIYGLNARNESVNELYSSQGGVLRPRGYFALPESESVENLIATTNLATT